MLRQQVVIICGVILGVIFLEFLGFLVLCRVAVLLYNLLEDHGEMEEHGGAFG